MSRKRRRPAQRPTRPTRSTTPPQGIDDEAYRLSFIGPGDHLETARGALRSIRDRERIEAALLARLGSGDLTAEYPGLGKYSLRQHEQECLPKILRGEGAVADA